jgi:hypothetical protein
LGKKVGIFAAKDVRRWQMSLKMWVTGSVKQFVHDIGYNGYILSDDYQTASTFSRIFKNIRQLVKNTASDKKFATA